VEVNTVNDHTPLVLFFMLYVMSTVVQIVEGLLGRFVLY